MMIEPIPLTCARCGCDITPLDVLGHNHGYKILNEPVILHFCKKCFCHELGGD